MSGLTDSELTDLEERGRPHVYKSGDVVFLEGDRSDRVVLIVDGNVKITSVTEDGQEIVLAVRGPGDLIGELSVLDGGPRSASAYALDEVRARIIGAGEFEQFLEKQPRFAMAQLRTLVGRLRYSDAKRIELSGYDTDNRVARRLLELADSHGEPAADGIRITLRLSQDELAGWTGASREAVARALRRFREAGLLVTERRQITIVDQAGLERRTQI